MNEIRKQPDLSADGRTAEPLESPMLSFDLNTEIEKLRGKDAGQRGQTSKTLVKYSDFRVVLTVMNAGARMEDHKTAGSISVQTVAGQIRMRMQDKVFELPTGHLLALDRGVVHDVEAVEDSAFLLTIVWHEVQR
jgi:quercetin dioxygenase-like cupin family protein